jgi:hypothetical protein
VFCVSGDEKRDEKNDAAGRFIGMASPSAIMDGLASVFTELGEIARELHPKREFGQNVPSSDIDRETKRQIDAWNASLGGREADLKVGVRPTLLARWLGDRWVDRCVRVDSDVLNLTEVQQIVDSLLPDVPIQRRKKAKEPQREKTEGTAAPAMDADETRTQDPPSPTRRASRRARAQSAELKEAKVQEAKAQGGEVSRGKVPDVKTELELLVVDRDAFALELAREWVRTGLPRAPVR